MIFIAPMKKNHFCMWDKLKGKKHNRNKKSNCSSEQKNCGCHHVVQILHVVTKMFSFFKWKNELAGIISVRWTQMKTYFVKWKGEFENSWILENCSVGLNHFSCKFFGLRSDLEASESLVKYSGSGVLKTPTTDLSGQIVHLIVAGVPADVSFIYNLHYSLL